MAKGRRVSVTGRVEHREWITDSVRRSIHEVIAAEVGFLDAASKDAPGTTAGPGPAVGGAHQRGPLPAGPGAGPVRLAPAQDQQVGDGVEDALRKIATGRPSERSYRLSFMPWSGLIPLSRVGVRASRSRPAWSTNSCQDDGSFGMVSPGRATSTAMATRATP